LLSFHNYNFWSQAVLAIISKILCKHRVADSNAYLSALTADSEGATKSEQPYIISFARKIWRALSAASEQFYPAGNRRLVCAAAGPARNWRGQETRECKIKPSAKLVAVFDESTKVP
jgi:hypothetical protein